MARKLMAVVATSAAVAAVGGGSAAADVETKTSQERFVPGEALVRYERGTVAAERGEARREAGVAFEDSLELPRTQLVSFDGSVRAAVARLERQPGVADAQPNYRYHAFAAPPTDTFFVQLWGLGAGPGVNVLPAWDRTRGSGQVIAVADTGVDLTHPDLVANLWANPGEVAGNGIDDDGNGGIDDVRGYDFVDDDGNPDDYQFHGTHVAGTAAAVADNAAGVAGVAPQAQIMAVRVLNGDGSGSSSTIANGIAYAADEGAGVVNLSLGGAGNPAPDSVMGQAVTFAETRGTTVVAAAGNGGADGVGDNNDVSPTTPCNLGNANLICVAAVTAAGDLASYSNFGATNVDVGAPGGDGSGVGPDILSAKTSWATPVFTEGFEGTGTPGWTATQGPGDAVWGQSTTVGSGSTKSATDSPAGNYADSTSSKLEMTIPSLAGRQGCRMHFHARLDTETATDLTGAPFDFLSVLAVTGVGSKGKDLFGSTGTPFEVVDMTISDFDGRSDVKASLQFTSDAGVFDDGVWVDNIKVLCRASGPGDYDNDPVPANQFELPAGSGGGSYMAISGTSMATPHVAGVAALVRAADPGAPPAQVVQAIKNGAQPLASLSGFTTTGGRADALAAIDAALALPNPPPPVPTPIVTPPTPPTPPGKAGLAGRLSADRKGRISMRITGAPNARGVLTLTATVGRSSAARSVTIARKSFQIGATGKATVRLKLNKAGLKQLRRKRKLRARARVVLTNAAGLKSTTTKPVRIALRR